LLHRPRATATLLVALLLSAATPVAVIQAADTTGLATNAAEQTPLNTNIARNAQFETVSSDGSIPGWTVAGDVRVEKFGDRAWPYPAYGKKWGGGKRYLACGKYSGLVRQTVEFNGWKNRTFSLKASLQVDFGGVVGHKIRVTIRSTGERVEYFEKVRVMDITYHYKKAVAGIRLSPLADHIEITVQLIRKSGASACRMVADNVRLIVSKYT
jgi:hypothetical protein